MVNVPNCEYVFLVSGTNIWHHYIFKILVTEANGQI